MEVNRERKGANQKEQLLNLLEQLRADGQQSVIFKAIDLSVLKGSATIEQIDERNYLIEYKRSYYIVNDEENFLVIHKLN